jgi:hypothetical protein
MGRQSCSIQRFETSVDVAVVIRAQFVRFVSSQLNAKEKAMTKTTHVHLKDETRFNFDFRFTSSIKRFIAVLVVAAAASLTALGVVGNQSA